jgi:DNA modification methylase
VDLTPERERALSLVLNSPEVAGVFTKSAAAMVQEVAVSMPDLSRALRMPNLKATLDAEQAARVQRGKKHRKIDPDEVPEPVEPTAKLGDVFTIGKHRIACGKFEDDAAVAALCGDELGHAEAVIIDPPYAIYGSSTGVASEIVDDAMVAPFFASVFRRAWKVLDYYGHVYVFCDWRSYATIWQAAKAGHVTPRNCIVWNKGGQGLGSHYMNCYELTWFGAKLPEQTAMGARVSGQRAVHRPNIFNFPRVTGEDRQHNAAKPVDLLREYVRNSTNPDGLVLDYFTGSGSVVVACELEGRRCFAMDHDPKWVDVTVARLEQLTGAKAELVG